MIRNKFQTNSNADWSNQVRIAAFLMPFLALLAGGAGFVFRRLELVYVFDAVTGLPTRGAVVTYTLIAICAAFALIALLFSIFVACKRNAPRGFENSFGTDGLSYPFSFGIIGLIWLGATIVNFLNMRQTGTVLLTDIYFTVLSAIAAISVSFFAVEMFQDGRRKSVYALSVIPTLFMCFWLVMLYRDNATNPILLSFAYKCLAIITSALGFYFTSGFVYGKPAPGKTLFFYFTAILFCFVTIADNHTMMVRIIFAAILAMNVLYSSKLIRHLRIKQK